MMSRQKFLRWEKQRLKGKRYFVAKVAIISGIFFFITLNLASWAWSQTALSNRFFLAYIVLGLIAGNMLWSMNEDGFEEFIEAKKANARQRR